MKLTPVSPSKVIVNTPVLDKERQFTLPDSSTPELAHLLTNALVKSLYSDPLKAFIREAIQNAIDAMRVNNTLDKGIFIHMPTEDNPKLSITDYGAGISEETFNTTYGKLGYSTKREDNTLNGGFGIGRLSIVAASEQGYITTIHNGFKYVYFLSLKDTYSYQLISKTECSEPTGTTVEIVVDIKKNSSSIKSIYLSVYTLTAFLDFPVHSNNYLVTEINAYCRSNFSCYSVPNTPISYKVQYTKHPDSLVKQNYSVAIQIGDITYYDVNTFFNSEDTGYSKIDKETVLKSKSSLILAKLKGLGYKNITNIVSENTYKPVDIFVGSVYPLSNILKTLDSNLLVISVPPNFISLSTNREVWLSTENDKIGDLILTVFSDLSSRQNAHLRSLYKSDSVEEFIKTLAQYGKTFNVDQTYLEVIALYPKKPGSYWQLQKGFFSDSPNANYTSDLAILPEVNINEVTKSDLLTDSETVKKKLRTICRDFCSGTLATVASSIEDARLKQYPGGYSTSSIGLNSYSVLLPKTLSSSISNPDLAKIYAAVKTLKEYTRYRSNPLYTGKNFSDDWYYFDLPLYVDNFLDKPHLKEEIISAYQTYNLAYLTSLFLFMESNVIFYIVDKNLEDLLDIKENKISFVKSLLTDLPQYKPTVLIPLREEISSSFETKIRELPVLELHNNISYLKVSKEFTLDTTPTNPKKEQKKSSNSSLKPFITAKAIRQIERRFWYKSVDYIHNIYDYTEVCTPELLEVNTTKYFMIAGHPGNLPFKAITLDNFGLIAPFIPKDYLYLVTPAASEFLKTKEGWVEVEELYKQVLQLVFKRYSDLFKSLNYTFSTRFFSKKYTEEEFKDYTDSKSCQYIWEILHKAYKKIKSRELELLIELLQPDYRTALRKAVQKEYGNKDLEDLVELIDPEYMKLLREAKANNSPAESLKTLINFNHEFITYLNQQSRASMTYWLTCILNSSWGNRNKEIWNNNQNSGTLKSSQLLADISGLNTEYSRYKRGDMYNEVVCPLYKQLFQYYPLLRWIFPVLECTTAYLDEMYPIQEILDYMERT
jgi:hypothetical protein